MSKSRVCAVALLVALAAPAAGARATAALGPDTAACREGAAGPAVLVRIDGFMARTGKIRVQLYGDNPDDFLARGRKLRRIDLPVTPSGPMAVCVAVPKAGNYAIAVRHDRGGDGSDWSDGAGFSRNPELSLLNLKPRFGRVVFPVGGGVRTMTIVLNYRQGLAIKPVLARRR